MDANFWHEIWEKNDLGFHEAEFNQLMVAHFSELSLTQNTRVFVPLCGKTLDIHWLLSQGYQVAGCELSELAVSQLFEELNLTPKVTQKGALKHFSAENIDIFAGDIFELSSTDIGEINAIYDRGALVALPLEMRLRYVAHIAKITDNASQFILTFEYDTDAYSGPPFAILEKDLNDYYPQYNAIRAAKIDFTQGLRGFKEVEECAWVLTPA